MAEVIGLGSSEQTTLSGLAQAFADSTHYLQASLVSGAVIVLILVLVAVLGPLMSPYNPLESIEVRAEPPTWRHLMGTDSLGRDLLSRVLAGTRYSLSVAVAAVVIASGSGVLLGMVSGYHGGRLVDKMLSSVMDALYAFPLLMMALIVAAVFGADVLNITLAIGLTSIPPFFRVVRSITVSVRETTLVEAARAIGAGDLHIMLRHILPRVMSSVIGLVSLTMANSVVILASLGFLGLGLPPPTPEWGADLSRGKEILLMGKWWAGVFPGLALCLAAFGFNSVGNGLNEMLNPRLRRG